MTTAGIHWSAWKKFAFLFIALYTFFYIFPFPFDAFPQLNFIFNPYGRLHDAFVHWSGATIFSIQNCQKPPFSDSGDTAFDFTAVAIFFLLSGLLAFSILFIDKKRNNYEKLNAWLFLYIRYCIGFYMLVYGFDKVFKSHFPFPSLEKLEQPIGQSTPQGLLWAFMGYSTPYTIYIGLAEVISGFLLLFRRTTALGAVIALIIMINVTIVNFSYDVPVKLFALHMSAYSILLLSPFINSMFSFFILQKETKLPEQPAAVFPYWLLKYKTIIKSVFVVSFTALFISFSIANMRTDGDDAPQPPLYGIYTARSFQIINSPVSDLEGCPDIFNKIIFDKKNTAVITDTDTLYFETFIDTTRKGIFFRSNADQKKIFAWKYELIENDLILRGNKPDDFELRFRKVDLNSYPLLKRKFHWVVEYPYNN